MRTAFSQLFRTWGRGLFVLSSHKPDIGVGTAIIGMLSAFCLGVLVTNPEAQLKTSFAAAGSAAFNYLPFVLITLAFWLVMVMLRPIDHIQNTRGVRRLGWLFVGFITLAGTTMPLWLWAAFNSMMPVSFMVRDQAKTWLGLSAYSSQELIMTAIITMICLTVIFYALVQAGSSGYQTNRSTDNLTSHSLAATVIVKTLSRMTWVSTSSTYRFLSNQFASWRIKRQADGVMRGAQRQAASAQSAYSQPSGVNVLHELLDENRPASSPMHGVVVR